MKRRRFTAHPRHPLTGRQFAVSAPTRRGLDALLEHVDSLRQRLRLGIVSPVDVDRQLRRLSHGPVTLARVVDAYLAREDLAAETKRRVRSWLRSPARELRDRELDDLDAPTVAAWLSRVRARGAASSTGLAWRTLRALVRFAAERGWIGRSPWGAWRPSARVAGAAARGPREACRSREELEQLIAGAGGDGELEAKLAVAGYLGLRNSELARLTWRDVLWPESLAPGAIVVRGSKGTPSAFLEAPPSLFDRLGAQRWWLEQQGFYAPGGPVFPNPATSTPGMPGKPRPYASVALSGRELRAAVARAGLPHPERWSPHSLRDSFATIEHARLGGDLARLRERTRHASIASLFRYLRARVRDPLPQLTA